MNEIERIVETMKQAHDGGAWHGPSVGEALDGVDAQTAARRPLEGAHTIWEIVEHVRLTGEAVRGAVTGEPADAAADWAAPAQATDAAWREALARLKTSQQALRRAVERLPESRLHETIPGKSHSYWYELMGLVHHDLYHAGQISLLKKGA